MSGCVELPHPSEIELLLEFCCSARLVMLTCVVGRSISFFIRGVIHASSLFSFTVLSGWQVSCLSSKVSKRVCVVDLVIFSDLMVIFVALLVLYRRLISDDDVVVGVQCIG